MRLQDFIEKGEARKAARDISLARLSCPLQKMI